MAVTLFILFILLLSNHEADGILRFASYYGDHMVLQKSPERAVLWGYGPEDGQVFLLLFGPTIQRASPVNVKKGQYNLLSYVKTWADMTETT
ncbi:sialate O-acetylesterase-like [Labrus mixtus]|uniref:sialate O-acetylesterase-like n=1 Tax=Labrus mixtus TaxID=508554 RepID=UPI0029BFB255|nr:sialate O-acetylesterase-like [Labrus mixtus]